MAVFALVCSNFFLDSHSIPELFFASHPVNIAYSDFIKLLKAHKIDNVLLEENYITANVKTEGLATFLPEDKLNEIKQYGGKEPQVTTVRINDPSLVPALEAAKVKFNGQIESKWLTMLLSWVIPALLFLHYGAF